MGQNSSVFGCVGFTDEPGILQVRTCVLCHLCSFLLNRFQNNQVNEVVFFSSQGDGPMCRPEIVLPDQTSDEEFQVSS